MAQVNLAGTKVMVIDDSNTIRRSAEIFLKSAGCEVILAEDGFDALAKIADQLQQAATSDLCRYHDAALGWIPNLCTH